MIIPRVKDGDSVHRHSIVAYNWGRKKGSLGERNTNGLSMQYAAQRNADIGLHDEYSKCLQGDMVQNVFTDYKIQHSLLHSKPILWKYTK